MCVTGAISRCWVQYIHLVASDWCPVAILDKRSSSKLCLITCTWDVFWSRWTVKQHSVGEIWSICWAMFLLLHSELQLVSHQTVICFHKHGCLLVQMSTSKKGRNECDFYSLDCNMSSEKERYTHSLTMLSLLQILNSVQRLSHCLGGHPGLWAAWEWQVSGQDFQPKRQRSQCSW